MWVLSKEWRFLKKQFYISDCAFDEKSLRDYENEIELQCEQSMF